MTNFDQWDGFDGRLWKEEVNTRDFIQHNYKPYENPAGSSERGARKGRRSGYGYPHCFRYHFPWPWLHQRG